MGCGGAVSLSLLQATLEWFNGYWKPGWHGVTCLCTDQVPSLLLLACLTCNRMKASTTVPAAYYAESSWRLIEKLFAISPI